MLKDSQEKVWKSLNLAFVSAQKKGAILHSADWIIVADEAVYALLASTI